MSDLKGRHYIAGEWVDAAADGWLHSNNPANGCRVGTSPKGSETLAEAAVEAARHAFEKSSWAMEPRLRAGVLLEVAARLEARQSDIARLLVQENGKIIGQAMHEVAAAVSETRYYAGLARNIFGRTFESGSDRMSLLTREPAGVVAVIVPWNAPVTLLVRSLAPALAAGCCVVVKPAAQTALTNAAVIGCFDGIEGLPDGCVNSVNESGTKVGRTLVSHTDVDVVSFTGSSRTGKIIMASAAETIKHVSLELGGKAPALVFADADLELAIAEIRRSAIALNGQMCTSVSRVLVDRAVSDRLERQLPDAFDSVKVGDPLHPGTELGPLIDMASRNRILGIIGRAGEEAELLLRGRAPGGVLESGSFVTPTLFRTDDPESWLVQTELFGPVVALEVFEGEEEAIAKANATRFGLVASVFTRDLNRAMRVARRLKFGTVWLNSHNRLMAEAETGGYRESGIGRLHGVEAMNDFLETKHIYVESGD
ncbi:MAG: aldehyde dehydrogenase family protein [Rhodobacteraceae bacterium]|nr:aldehyde dehydrogenase family protein [Paracoccaceae bacterium]